MAASTRGGPHFQDITASQSLPLLSFLIFLFRLFAPGEEMVNEGMTYFQYAGGNAKQSNMLA